MESIKADFSLLEKPASQPSPGKTNPKNRYEVLDFTVSYHTDISKKSCDGRPLIVDSVLFPAVQNSAVATKVMIIAAKSATGH